MGDWRPTPSDVKSLVPTRVGGQPFDDDTVPTRSEVVSLIDGVAAEVSSEVGAVPDDDDLEAQARWAVTLGAAYYVEQGYFPEQQESGGPAERMYERYQRQLDRLRKAIGDYGTDDNRASVATIRTPSAVVAGYDPYATDPWIRS